MGKLGGLFTDNPLFEAAASESGVDGVFVAHIKGQFLYRGTGDVPYYIDGGGGGALYTTGPVGTDHGYWHGFRLIRVRGDDFVTDAVPIFVRNGIRIAGGRRLEAGVDPHVRGVRPPAGLQPHGQGRRARAPRPGSDAAAARCARASRSRRW